MASLTSISWRLSYARVFLIIERRSFTEQVLSFEVSIHSFSQCNEQRCLLWERTNAAEKEANDAQKSTYLKR